nr:MarR family transcriptional regulator [uncultured Dyadobacter sp.]
MAESNTEPLKLENQLCFPLYVASRLVTQCYQPVLEELGLTYPQYLVLMTLWETDCVTVSVLSKRLYLQSNTLTPLLKRMQEMGLVNRDRSRQDERSVIISLTAKGKELEEQAPKIRDQLTDSIDMTVSEAEQLKSLLHKLIKAVR